MADIESPVVAPTPSARALRRSARLGCQKEQMPLKERCVGTPRVTMKKPGKVMKDSASFEKQSASTEKQTEFFDKDCPSLAHFWNNTLTFTEANNLRLSIIYAQRGLKLYQKTHKDTVFDSESVQVLSSKKSKLRQEGGMRNEYWLHICFTAKPKNSDTSPKHFLVEVTLGPISNCWNVKHCCTFEPKDDAGLDHDCIICKNDLKIHPSTGEYYVGSATTCRKAEDSLVRTPCP